MLAARGRAPGNGVFRSTLRHATIHRPAGANFVPGSPFRDPLMELVGHFYPTSSPSKDLKGTL